MKIKLGDLRKIIREVSRSDSSENRRSVPFPPKYPDQKAHFEWIETFGEYSDVYKEKNGIRPRWVTEETTSLEKLKQMLQDLYDEPSSFDDDGY